MIAAMPERYGVFLREGIPSDLLELLHEPLNGRGFDQAGHEKVDMIGHEAVGRYVEGMHGCFVVESLYAKADETGVAEVGAGFIRVYRNGVGVRPGVIEALESRGGPARLLQALGEERCVYGRRETPY